MTLANEGRIVRLYHGSDMAIERPDIVHNTGFADLGVGFYLTDDKDAAINRARRRARERLACGHCLYLRSGHDSRALGSMGR